MNFREVDEHGHTGRPGPNRLLQPLKLAPDARQVAHDLGQPHDGHLLGAHHALQARGRHARPAHAEEAGRLSGCGKLFLQRGDQQRSVVLAAGLSCRDEDRGGHFPLLRAALSSAGDHHSGSVAVTGTPLLRRFASRRVRPCRCRLTHGQRVGPLTPFRINYQHQDNTPWILFFDPGLR